MTEYTTSSQAFREYMTARERTAYWVQSHSSNSAELYSPSVPPSTMEGEIPSSSSSEAESSHSVPPQMVLRFPDGRPDVPIPYGEDYSNGSSHSKYNTRMLRSQTLPQSLHGTVSRRLEHRDNSGPEEIRILPSRTNDNSATISNHLSAQTRSKSLPRNAYSNSQATILPPPHAIPSQNTSHHTRIPSLLVPPPVHTPPAPLQIPVTPGPQVSFSQPHTQPSWHPYTGQGPHARRHPPKHTPPAIVYAPAHHSKSRYAPPAIYSHPPVRGPNGMVYSHSAPVGHSYYPHAGSTPYPSAISSSHLSSVHEERRSRRSRSRGSRRDRSRSATLTGSGRHRSPSASTDSFESHGTGSTYYVLPSAGQKVHIIAPEPSIFTATSTTKSPASPRSGNSIKKPFFQRLFSFTDKFSSADSAKGSSKGSGRRLVRRHSTGGSGRGKEERRSKHHGDL